MGGPLSEAAPVAPAILLGGSAYMRAYAGSFPLRASFQPGCRKRRQANSPSSNRGPAAACGQNYSPNRAQQNESLWGHPSLKDSAGAKASGAVGANCSPVGRPADFNAASVN